jgi:Flp pilus assembly protein TadG
MPREAGWKELGTAPENEGTKTEGLLPGMNRSAREARERGSAQLEFALVFTLILGPLLFGIMDFSRAMYAYHFVSNAAREASRYAMVRGSTWATACSGGNCPCTIATAGPTLTNKCNASDDNITSYVQSIVPPGISVSSASTFTCPAPAPAAAGQLYVCTLWPGTPPIPGTGSCSASIATGSSGPNNPGCYVEIQVQYLYKFSLPFVSKSVSTINMASTSEVVIQQ